MILLIQHELVIILVQSNAKLYCVNDRIRFYELQSNVNLN
jgi:hypothetical protein